MFVLLTKRKEKSIISTASTREANKYNSTESHSLPDSPFPLSLEVQVSVIFTKTTNYGTLKTILFVEKINGAREGFSGGGPAGAEHASGTGYLSKWMTWNGFCIACSNSSFPQPVAGAKREGGGGKEKTEPSLSNPPPFSPSSQSPIPFGAC